jgi:hypothetical protein
MTACIEYILAPLHFAQESMAQSFELRHKDMPINMAAYKRKKINFHKYATVLPLTSSTSNFSAVA